MCGILGGVYFNSQANESALQTALSRLSHRGPDSSALQLHQTSNHSVALGHVRLSIIDLEGGKQPLNSADGNLHLVANGEIYNYVEIAKDHPQLSQQALSHSDCEGIFQAYQAAGVDGFQQLNGMYAFALYDQQTSQFILVRDRLGIKPLFYYQSHKGLFFASEIKALLPLIEDENPIDPSGMAQFLQHQYHTGSDTIFAKIKRVLPGEYLTLNLLDESPEVRTKSYWDISAIKTQQCTVIQAKEAFEPLFEQVMQEHLRADVPVGLFLSGGIDSSILLAKLSEQYSHPLKTYSLGFSGTKMADELDAATALAKHFGTEHQALRVDRDMLFNRIVHSIWAADDLMRDYASLPTHMLAETAGRDLKVVFSGEGGDEAFAGYRRYSPNPAKWLYHQVLGQDIRVRNQWHPKASNSVFSQTLRQAPTKNYHKDLWRQAKSLDLMQRRQYVDIKSALPDNLFIKTDRMLMAFGLEGRVPFSDHRLIEFGLSLPPEVKYQQGRGKWLLREWAKKYLPAAHLAQPKRGFYVPVKEWLGGEFLKQLEQKLLNNRAIQHWFIDKGIRTLFAQHKAGRNYSREIWCLMQFAIWHTLFIDKPGVIPSHSENPLDWI
ncbi:MAG: asparagine synthase (glutamine-hydrolyzing) [Alteromonadaceae bacterium]|nr:MAG: asparagine synthase (glutamine-hydrolyzing) [Alteromonadaceae bacterium]